MSIDVYPYAPHAAAKPSWVIVGQVPGVTRERVQLATCHDEQVARVIAARLSDTAGVAAEVARLPKEPF